MCLTDHTQSTQNVRKISLVYRKELPAKAFGFRTLNSKNMKTILVPCDFSKPAKNAFRFALDMAAQANATVHLLNVMELPVLHDTVIMPVLSFEEDFLKEIEEKTKKEMRKTVEKYANEDVKVISEIKMGPLFDTILNYVGENSIDTIVMGSHGASGLKEIIIGSNAEKIVRRSPVPVIVVKDFYKGPVKNIIFPNTLEMENQEDLVQKVKSLQNLFKAKLHVVWINTPMNFTSDTVTLKRLKEFVKRYMLKDYSINIFNHAVFEDGLIEFSNMMEGDMIAMGTHGRKGLAHFIKGSLAENIVNESESLMWTSVLRDDKELVEG
jgi:nucleotide-binding universal stress UspA family protein